MVGSGIPGHLGADGGEGGMKSGFRGDRKVVDIIRPDRDHCMSSLKSWAHKNLSPDPAQDFPKKSLSGLFKRQLKARRHSVSVYVVV